MTTGSSAVTDRIAAADAATVPHGTGLRAALRDRRVVALSVAHFGVVFGLYVLAFFLPQVVSDLQERFGVEFSLVRIGLITAIPYAVASVAMLANARHSDRTGERVWHVALPVFAAAGIALINSLGNLSGFVAPYLTGWLADLTGSFRPGMWTVAGFMVLAGAVVLLLDRRAPDPARSTR